MCLACMFVYHVYIIGAPQRSEEGIRCPEIGDPLLEQPELLTSEPPL